MHYPFDMYLRNFIQMIPVIAALFAASGCGCGGDASLRGNDMIPWVNQTVDEYLALIRGDKTIPVTWNAAPNGLDDNGIHFPPFSFDGPDDLVVTMVHGGEPFEASRGSPLTGESCSWGMVFTPITVRLQTANGRLDESVVATLWLNETDRGFIKNDFAPFKGSIAEYKVSLLSNQKQLGQMEMYVAPDGSIEDFALSIVVETTVENGGGYSYLPALTQRP